jgi:hypothetical protein
MRVWHGLGAYMWLLTTPLVVFRGSQVSAMAAGPMLDRIAVAVAMALLPVGAIIGLVSAWRRGTLNNHVILPWWCLALFAILVFPVFFGYLVFEFERAHDHGVAAAFCLTTAWTAPHAIALTLLAVTMASDRGAGKVEQPAPEVADSHIAPTDSVAETPSIPADVPHYRPGTAPGNLRTDWQLSQDGLKPGGPARGWLLLNNGPGMYLYDIHEAR